MRKAKEIRDIIKGLESRILGGESLNMVVGDELGTSFVVESGEFVVVRKALLWALSNPKKIKYVEPSKKLGEFGINNPVK
jgi:hypothetical protein